MIMLQLWINNYGETLITVLVTCLASYVNITIINISFYKCIAIKVYYIL